MEGVTLAQNSIKAIEALERQSYHDLVKKVSSNAFQTVRDANSRYFSLRLPRFRGTKTYKQIQVCLKNEEIRHLHYAMKSKLKGVQIFHLSLLEELSRLKAEIEIHGQEGLSGELSETAKFLCTEGRLLVKYTPLIIYHSLVKGKDSVLSDLGKKIEAICGQHAATHLFTILDRYRTFVLYLHDIESLQVRAREFLESNKERDATELLQQCSEMMGRPLDPLYLKSKKWKAVFQSSHICTAKLQLLKAKLLQKLELFHPQANLGGREDPVTSQLSHYADATFAKAKQCELNSRSMKACWWYHVTVQMHTMMGREPWGIHVRYGKVLTDTCRYEEALKHYKLALQSINREVYDIETIGEIMYLIGNAYGNLELYKKSANWYARVIDFGVSIHSLAFDVYHLHYRYASILIYLQRFPQCESLLNVVKYSSQLDFHPRLCNSFGFLYLSWQKFELSEEWLRMGIQLKGKDTVNLRINLCNLCIDLERWQEADQILSSLVIARNLSTDDKAYTLASLGCIKTIQRSYSEAEKNLKRAWDLQTALVNNIREPARTARYLGGLYIETGQFEEAEHWSQKALDMYYLKYNPSHIITAVCYNILAQVALSTDNLEVAGDNLQKALSICSNFPTFIETADVFHGMGMLCMKLNQYSEARDWLQKALCIQTQVIPQTMKTARTYCTLGLLSRDMTQLREAKDCFQAALSIQISRFPRDRSTVDTYLSIAEVEELSFDFEAAELSLKTALHIMEELNPSDPQVREVLMRIGNICDRLNKDEEVAE